LFSWHTRQLAWENFAAMQFVPASIGAGALAAGSGVFAWGAFAPESQLFGRTIRRTGDLATMALTFDDGPNPAVTPALLDLLDRHSVKATFFVIGEFVRAVPALAREISARGHVLGNHTQTHPSLTFCSPSRTRAELDQCDDAIEAATGKKPGWMRPPFGFRSPILDGIARKRGSAGVVMWSASARDWKPQRAESVIERLRRARGGDIVLLHDGDHRVLKGDRRHTVEAMAHWLPRWKDAGIRFVTLDELREQA
jgi:peptidoglycan/xylan/chitin deacetylase (PgdA/CDA1 family)